MSGCRNRGLKMFSGMLRGRLKDAHLSGEKCEQHKSAADPDTDAGRLNPTAIRIQE